MMHHNDKPTAVITGVSRSIGIGAAIAGALAEDGWNTALTFWRPYDGSMPWGNKPEEIEEIASGLRQKGAEVHTIEADLSNPCIPSEIFSSTETALGPVTALVMCHCHSVDSSIRTTSIESFDLHFAINARATWLLVKEFAERFSGNFGSGRIISITSDHVAGNLPYGASKGAMDRIVLAAAEEYRSKGITANVINPGATDTGWMNDELEEYIKNSTFLNRTGKPEDCANLASFLCSSRGGWINGQLIYSNGGIKYS